MNQPNIELIGQGGYGRVYLLKDYDPPIIMKEMYQALLLNEQQRELDTLKELMNPNIVKYMDQPLDFAYEGTNCPIFMEFCEEGSLRNLITDKTLNYSVATIVKWSIEIFSALVYLKSMSIAHRDIKAENIFVNKFFTLKVGDFGVIKRFQADQPTLNTFVRGDIYLAPEMNPLKEQKLSKEEIYKCDAFAAGLVIWEMMERITLFKLYTKLDDLKLLATTCPNVEKLRNLVIQCSSPRMAINYRSDADQALERANDLEELFTGYFCEPERNRDQQVLREPVGLHLIDDSDILPSDLNSDFSFGKASQTQPIAESQPTEPKSQIDSKNQRFLNEWMRKIERKTNFSGLTMRKDEDVLKEIGSMKLGTSGEEITSVNEIREFLCQEFLLKFQIDQLTSEEQREFFIEMQEAISNFSENFNFESIFKEKDHIEKNLEEYLKKKENISKAVFQVIEIFAKLLTLDFYIQEFCVRFAIKTLWNCDSLAFSWLELTDLLDTATQNICEVEKIFFRRKPYTLHYVDPTRVEWFADFGYAFRKDLSEVRRVDFVNKAVSEPKGQRQTIGVETIRRSLNEKRQSVEKYSIREQKNQKKFIFTMQEFLEYTNQWSGYYMTKDPFVNFPENEADLRAKVAQFRAKSEFGGHIFSWDSIPENLLSCTCSPSCLTEKFPEKAPLKELQLDYSNCSKINRKEFLDVHSMFERSFRLIHFWETLEIQHQTHLSLIEKLLKDMEDKTDPLMGFFFLYMRELRYPSDKEGEDQNRGLCHQGNEETVERRGLLIGLGISNENSFWNEHFKLQNASTLCLMEYLGLVWISLNELREFLTVMLRFLWNWQEGFEWSPNKLDSVMYLQCMKENIENFWKDRKIYH